MIIINAIIRKKNEITNIKYNLPGIVYGKKNKNILINLDHNQIITQEHKKEFYSPIILIIKNERINALIKDIQRHPFKKKLLHVDFLRI